MRITRIRDNKGKKIDFEKTCQIAETLFNKLNRKGFRTKVVTLSNTTINIGLHGSSFRINTNALGYNAKLVSNAISYKGYKRTDVPTWQQRVKFNEIINQTLDNFKISATIKSGIYKVRKGTKSMTEWDWENTSDTFYNFSGNASRDIMTEHNARKYCNSDELEKDYKESIKLIKKQKSRVHREKMKAFKNSKKVMLKGFSPLWDGNNTLTINNKNEGKIVTHKEFNKILSTLSYNEKKNVKRESIKATLENIKAVHDSAFVDKLEDNLK